MQINRLFEIVYILMNKKNVTAKELGERFEVSQRTIYRDIETLCQAGIPIYTNKGKGGGICLMENFVINKSVLSEQEQKEILSALQGLKATSYPESDQVLSKLNSLFGNKITDWIEVDFSYWSSNDEDRQKFYNIKDAILNSQVIQFNYYNSYGQESHRFLEPRKLVFKGQAWYLFGYCRDRLSHRYFKISRIKGLELTEESFTQRPLDNIEDEPISMMKQPFLDVVLKVNASMAYRVYDEFPAEGIEKQQDGSFLIHHKLMENGWIYGYLMSFEDQLEILEPKKLREELIGRYKNVLNKYNMTH